MRVALYCQHVLGMGHYFRTLEILRALTGHRVLLISGGEAPPVAPPGHVRELRLPPLRMDERFTGLSGGGAGAGSEAGAGGLGDLEEIKARRAALLMEALVRERPEVLFIELHPFGRKAFEFELLLVLRAARAGAMGQVRVVSGLRDILVEKKDQAAYETRVLARLDSFYDALLVHSDPRLFPLSATFSRVRDIPVPVLHTGYVAQARAGTGAAPEATRRRLDVAGDRALVVASAGGGRVGGHLLLAAVEACRVLETTRPLALRVFAGPFAPEDEVAALSRAAKVLADARVARFEPHFPDVLAAADLSVSLGGYNTVMALLGAGTRALVLPFDQNREQRLRAARLSEMGLMGLLEPDGLSPETLAGRLGAALSAPPPAMADIDLDGAARTVACLLAIGRGEVPGP